MWSPGGRVNKLGSTPHRPSKSLGVATTTPSTSTCGLSPRHMSQVMDLVADVGLLTYHVARHTTPIPPE